ncbi:hypothetical protein ABT85_06670 [Salmonella enterica subsp. enterica serovar Typhimurium]|nr:hypothetical protein ABT85_06670 [Salmonella enterica subsp. enterica serovar Typhimurium]KLT32897.1 hypothetical protein ABT82_06665 [Salmonella enterica subsp. enterica serovar Typhimurium]
MCSWRFTLNKITPEFPQRAKTLMRIALAQIDNALSFWFPANDMDIKSPSITKPAVKFLHELSPTVRLCSLWLRTTRLFGNLHS